MDQTVNILPLNDIKPHIESVHCHCNPSIDFINENGVFTTLIIHNSFDGREVIDELLMLNIEKLN